MIESGWLHSTGVYEDRYQVHSGQWLMVRRGETVHFTHRMAASPSR